MRAAPRAHTTGRPRSHHTPSRGRYMQQRIEMEQHTEDRSPLEAQYFWVLAESRQVGRENRPSINHGKRSSSFAMAGSGGKRPKNECVGFTPFTPRQGFMHMPLQPNANGNAMELGDGMGPIESSMAL